MPKPVYRKKKVKKAKKKYTCMACRDTGISSKGGMCVACQKRKGAM